MKLLPATSRMNIHPLIFTDQGERRGGGKKEEVASVTVFLLTSQPTAVKKGVPPSSLRTYPLSKKGGKKKGKNSAFQFFPLQYGYGCPAPHPNCRRGKKEKREGWQFRRQLRPVRQL